MDAKNNDTSDSRKTDDGRDKSSEPQGMTSEDRSRQRDTAGDRDPANVEWNIRLGYQIPPYESESTEMAAETEPGAQAKRKRTATPEASSESPLIPRPSRSPSSQSPPSPKRKRRAIPADWTPPLAVGASLGENLSRIEEAERLVLQWEAIIENARRTQPRADLTPFEERLELVRREYEELEETEENLTPPDELESIQRKRIADRLDELRGALESTTSAAGKINIQAAIDCYTNGRIQCWEYWTLIYGGHIVDTCPTYESFTIDREDRLDRYFEQYGNGWLWYEPPLAPKGDIQPDRLLAATWAQPSGKRNSLWGGEAGWDITMGFRQVKTFHSRVGKPEVLVTGVSFGFGNPPNTTSKEDPAAQRRRSSGKVLPYVPGGRHATEDEKWLVRDDNEGTRCFFLMQLDSGASLPCLYDADLRVLGIDLDTYPPQTYLNLSTAAGTTPSRVYELRVDVCKHNGETLVEENPVWPRERHELGGISPVAVMASIGNPPKGTAGPLSLEEVKLRREKGEDMSEEALATRRKKTHDLRLSGLMPFKVCYAACTPGQRLWFGEDRRDVLGIDRMPGQRRFEMFKQQKPEEVPMKWQVTDRPTTIIFEHEVGGTRIIDKDLEHHPGASIVTVTNGFETERNRLEPRRLPTQQPRESLQELKAQRDRDFLSLFSRLAKKGSIANSSSGNSFAR